jgi:DMSO/TMAO reductase YedYZ molybdopterin-dependent catalytic subunit
MRIRPFLYGALIGALITAPLIGIMYLAHIIAGLPFVPFDFFDWLTRVLPGDLITFGIDAMIDSMLALGISVADTAKTAERIAAILQFWVGGVVAGALLAVVLNWQKSWPRVPAGLALGVLFGLPLIVISLTIGQSDIAAILRLVYLLVLFLAWGGVMGWAAGRVLDSTSVAEETLLATSPVSTTPATESGEPIVAAESATATESAAAAGPAASAETVNRRQFLVRLGAGAATITVASGGLAAVLANSEQQSQATASAGSASDAAGNVPAVPDLPNADAEVQPAPGTRPEYTPVEDHYQVFIRTTPTVIDGAEWMLPVEGLVDSPLQLTVDDFRNNFESREQFVTLSCISGRIGTSLISTTKWTGVSVQDVLAAAGVQDNAQYLFITSGDGFYEIVDLNLINDDDRIMFCYAWDDEPLPVDHGFPLRIWIPDRYGMKQPKWITKVELIEEYTPGYWVERNWDKEALVKTTSVIDTVALDAIEYGENGEALIPVGGIAFSGDKGISKVEVRVDGGSWQEAKLRQPLSETTWVIWRYEWPFETGDHTFEVRCVEGDGTLQIEETQPNRPSGATGIHSYDV